MAEFQKRKQKTTWMVEILIYFWFSTKFVLKNRVDPKFVISFSEIRWKSCFLASFLRKIHNYGTHFSKSCVHMWYTCWQMTKSDFQIQHTCYTHVKSCVYLCVVQGSTLILTIVSEMTRQGPRTGPDCQTGFKTASCHQFETVLCKENKNRQFFARKMPKTSTFLVNLEYFRFHPFIKLKEKNYPKNTHLSRKSEYTIWSGSTWRFRNSGGVGGVNGRQGGQNCQKPPKKTPK